LKNEAVEEWHLVDKIFGRLQMRPAAVQRRSQEQCSQGGDGPIKHDAHEPVRPRVTPQMSLKVSSMRLKHRDRHKDQQHRSKAQCAAASVLNKIMDVPGRFPLNGGGRVSLRNCPPPPRQICFPDGIGGRQTTDKPG